MKKKESNKTNKKINVPTKVLVILLIVALGLGILAIVRDANNVNSAYSMVRKLYTLIFPN